MATQDVTFSLSGFPSPFKGTLEDFKTTFAQKLKGNIVLEDILKGRIGGVAPTSNVGPWADRQSWKTWDTIFGPRDRPVSGYYYNTIAVGNTRFLVKLDGLPTENHTLRIQDKPGGGCGQG